ncbi:hypothetical protein D9619_003667 [Psilocybe cf. subviscida]|uniref:Uncharacterized protein n=1 Tax=Psilocybe cf. subviscida TaxID=2480587 RepID=A0A8H5AVV0_9AGAR|nr:hypothetical protein D9619_003667 [Psilocybe cf. subviscida]
MEEVHGNVDLARASMYREAGYYLKFHEVMCSSLGLWKQHEAWVRETYWRLRSAGKSVVQVGKSKIEVGDAMPIIGPNVYHAKVRRPVRELRMVEEEQDRWVRDVEDESDVNQTDEEGESDDLEP